MTDTQTIHQFAVQNMLVEKYLLGELGGANLEDFEQHMFECSICFEAVKAGQVFTQSIKDVSSQTDWKAISRRLLIASFYLSSSGIVLMLASPFSIVIADICKVLECVAIGVLFFGLTVRTFIGGRS